MKPSLWTRNFTLLTLSNFLMCSAYYSLISTLPLFVSDQLHASHSVVGLVLSAYAVAAILIRPFTGFGLDYFGRRGIFIVSLLIYGLIFNVYVFAATVTFMFFLRFAHGLAWGLTTTSNTTVAGDIIPVAKRGEGFGLFGVSTTIGMALGPPIGTFILQHWGYNAMFISGSAVSIISMVMAAMMKYPAYSPLPENRQFKWKNLFETSTVIPSANLLIIGLAYGGLISFIALYGKEIGIKNPSGFFLVYALGIITSRFSVGKALDRNGPRLVIITCLTLIIIGYPILALIKTPWGYYTAAVILGLGNGVVWPTFQAMVNNIVPSNRRGAANSTLFIAMDLGMGLGMMIAGVISQKYSISAAFLSCAGYCALGLIIFRMFTLKHYLKKRVLVLVSQNADAGN